MLYKIKNFTYIFLAVLFLSFILFYYFSDDNREKINNNRLNSSNDFLQKIQNIPVLQNDTVNIYEYSFSETEDDKIKKRFFWDLLKTKNE
tara:strand:+ start:5280 stop:5549 length:270 start_codon:yes stop_codon:yes gene_type:complete